ncbi:hypothetical protein QCI42_01875 [Bacillus fungorum]|uniref:hypothetical protein n=1 Tax=Bacillus fungorum TaxID=2039284 RepID=UPI003396643A
MKNKLIAAGIVTGALLSYPSNIFADSISKVTKISQNNVEPSKQVENAVVGVVADADEYFATVEYKDSKGNMQTVEIDFSNEMNSSYKVGDKVNVANKDQWKQQKVGMHNVTVASADFVSKVTDTAKNTPQNNVEPSKQVENAVVGVVADADEYFATVEYKDSKGNMQTVEIDFLNESNSSYKVGDKVNVANKDQWKQQKVGMHNVTIVSANFVSKVTDTAKNTPQNNVEPSKQVENAVVGVVTDADEYFATVEYKDSKGNMQTVEIDFLNESNSSYKVGDKVNVANKDQWKQQKVGMHNVTVASADFVSKVTDTAKNTPQNNVEPSKQVEKAVVGVVADADEYFATVEYKDSKGNMQTVEIDFSNEMNSSYKVGDKVNVANKDQWKQQKVGMHNVTIASADFVSKVR